MSVFEAVAVPRLYRVIADQIASKIQQGEFSVGSRLPSERELAEQLQVSRASIREALIALELEGYVAVRVGTGVFVLSDQQRNLNQSPDVSQPAQVDNDFGPFGLLETRLLLEPESAEL
ncbi:MAG: FadR/GntR family transcriptional regulator, partial [Paenalcaligenes sp.]